MSVTYYKWYTWCSIMSHSLHIEIIYIHIYGGLQVYYELSDSGRVELSLICANIKVNRKTN